MTETLIANGNTTSRTISLFGGPSKLARKLSVPQSTVASWQSVNSIPAKWQGALLKLAKQLGTPLKAEDLIPKMIPTKIGNPSLTGPTLAKFSKEPAPMPKQEIEPGRFLNEIKKLSETQTVICFAGVGSAFAKRNDQTSLIIAKNRKTILVDIGTTIPQSLYRNGINITDFDYYHLTHAHADHIGGVEELLLMHRYMLKRPAKLIISPQFEQVLWENTLKGGSQINEAGILKFRDLIEPIEPRWIANQPRECFQICVEGIHLQIFRTIHTPGDCAEWEKAFWSTGLIIDGQTLFSGDTRFDPTLFSDLDLSQIEAIYHDCQLFNPNIVHAPYQDLNEKLPPGIKKLMYLTHYGDTFDNFNPEADGFAGFAQPFTPYCFKQR